MKTSNEQIMRLLGLIFCGLFLLGTSFSVDAQKMNKEILKTYPVSVVTRVYDIIRKVPLNTEKQLKLATLFQHEDSLVLVAIISDAEPSIIADIHRKSEVEMNHLLTLAELNQLYTAEATPLAQLQAKESVNKLKMSTSDTALLHRLNTLYFAKYLELGKLQLIHKFDTKQNNHIKRVSVYYDSIVTKVLVREGINTPNSIFFAAIQKNKILKLEEKQIDSLIKKGFELEDLRQAKRRNKQNNINLELFEKTTIQSILNKEQQDKLYVIINKEEAINEALVYWIELKQRNIANGFDSTVTVTKISNFLFRSKNIVYNYTNDAVSQTNRLKALNDSMPRPLWKLQIDRRITDKYPTQFFLAIKHKQNISLSEIQIDSLAKAGFTFENYVKTLEKPIGRTNRLIANEALAKVERHHLTRIMDKKQYYRYLCAINEEEATKEAIKNWNEIKRRNIVESKDSFKTMMKLNQYQLVKRVINAMYQDSPVIQHNQLQLLNNTVPLPLVRLFAMQRIDNPGKYPSLFIEAMTQKTQLVLSTAQIDSLAIKDFFLTNDFGDRPKGVRIYEAFKYERISIEHILTEEQYSRFYSLRNNKAATEVALKDWNDMIKFKLVSSSDSSEIIYELINFQLAQFIAKDRYVYDRNLQKQNLKAINQAMPETMQQLRLARLTNADSTNNSKRYRGTFKW